jgi:hypothetical protein
MAIEKLEGEDNYLQWLSQIKPIIRSNDLEGIIDGSEVCPPQFLSNENGQKTLNPEFTCWNKKDQFLLGWINTTLSRRVLSTVFGLNTSKLVWTSLATRFASESKPRVSHIKRQLQSIRQGSNTCSEYLQSAKVLADQLAAIGKPIEDDDLIHFVISGLNPTFNAFITTFSLLNRDNSLSFDDFQHDLLNHERLLNQQQVVVPDNSHFALFSNKTGTRNFTPRNKMQQQPPFRSSHQQQQRFPQQHQFSHQRFSQHQQSRYSSRGPPQKPHFSTQARQNNETATTQYPASINTSSGHTRAPCQICGKTSHQALDCFHRMDYSYQGRHPPPQLAAMAAQTNATLDEQEWLADSGANAHITNELGNLTIQQPFENNETVAVGNGSALTIDNSGSALIHSSNSDFKLHNVLHCPNASANLLSIQ